MTCRELIMYILINGLEDEPLFKDGKPVGFSTVEEFAVQHGVGNSTVEAWVTLGKVDHIKIGDVIYIPMFPVGSF